ncbi:hypothetical protein BHE74_00052024 [Ensete ventricosum]|nr:hypothetical protein BHE74_00052024 [Ensete ventricosum]
MHPRKVTRPRYVDLPYGEQIRSPGSDSRGVLGSSNRRSRTQRFPGISGWEVVERALVPTENPQRCFLLSLSCRPAMDSGNSSSLQSSSGGDDDFDCRVDSLSAFFRSSPAAATALPPSRSPPPLSSSYDGHHYFDDSSLNYLDSSAPLLPIGSSTAAPWPRHLNPSSSNCITTAAASLGARPVASSLLSSSSVQPQLEQPIGAAAAAAAPPSRSSKKRSRASRRAPTTVLTTDTSNFRAMVQEFTGIPAHPFAVASTSPFARSRFDLFYPADPPPPHFLLRPLPKKLQSPPSFIANPTSSPPPPRPSSTTNTAAAGANTKIPTDDAHYRSPSHDLDLGGGQRQPLVSHQSPILNLQSLLQPSQLQAKYYTIPAIAASYNAKTHITPSDAYKAHELGGLQPGLIGSEALHSSWTDGGADLAHLRPAAIDDYLDSQLRVGSSWKPNYSASGPSSEFTGEKASGSVVATRGEGMVESWIHYSD